MWVIGIQIGYRVDRWNTDRKVIGAKPIFSL